MAHQHISSSPGDTPSASSTVRHSIDVTSREEKPQHDDHDYLINHLPLSREIPFVIVLSLTQLLTQSGLAMSIVPLHIIGEALGIADSPGLLSWSPAAYSLTVGTFILFAGRLGDLYGHRKLVLIGWAWYGLFSILGGFAIYVRSHGDIYLDIFRALQGIGPAILLPNAIAILGRVYPPGRRKEFVFSLYGLTAPSGFAFGAIFTSLLSQYASWPWIYYINGIACFAILIASWVFIPQVDEYNPLREENGHLDATGAVLGVTGLVLVNFSWNQGPVAGWQNVYVYVILIVGFLFLGAFFWYEERAPHPLVPLKRLNKDIALVLAAVAAGWSSFGIWLYYLFQFWQVLQSRPPIQSAAQILPVIFSGGLAAITTGLLISRLRPGWLMLISMSAFCLGNVILSVTPVGLTYWGATFIATIVTPWGMDMSFPAANILASNFMPRDQQGLSASLVNTVINYSISIGLGIAGTVESNVAPEGSDVLKGYRSAWYCGIGLAGLGIGVSVVLLWVTRPMKGDVAEERPTEKRLPA